MDDIYLLNSSIPSYEELKSIKKYYVKDLYFPIYGGYFRLTINEDYRHTISLDYLEGGYLSSIIYNFNSSYSFNKLYPFNKKNYNGLIKLYKQALKTEYKNLEKYINILA